MKKICMIVPSFEAKGGIASVVRGYRGSALEKEYQIRYIETYCDGGKLAKLWKAICSYAQFLWTLIVFRPDLVHIHSSFGASFYRKTPFVLLASVFRIPVVNHIHGSELGGFYGSRSEAHRRFIRSIYARCSKILVLSERWKDSFSEMIDPCKMEVVFNYSVLGQRRAGDMQNAPPMVLFLGFLSELKGCFDIPKVAQLTLAQAEQTEFVLAGTGSAGDMRQIKAKAAALGVEHRLVFPGWITGEEKEALLRRASVFFLPSYTEGMPMSILEAMGYGIPVVSTTVGGIPELVQHGKNGFLLEPADAEGFAEAILTLLKDPEKRKEMGQAGRTFVKENCSLERHVGSLMCIYDSLVKEEQCAV